MRFPKLPVPAARPGDEPLEQVCINHDWVIVLMSIVDRLRYPASWLEVTDETQLENKVLELVKMFVEAKAMGCGCGCGETSNPTRFNADGELEVYDPVTGEWIPFPQGDPRQTATVFPPLPGADGDNKKCEAAANATQHIKDMADKLIADAGVWGNLTQLVAAVIAIVVFLGIIGSGGALTPLLVGLAGILLTTGQAAFAAEMTADKYDTLNCILYCNMNADASFSDVQIESIKTQIMAQFSGVSERFFYDHINILGKVGLTNAARTANSREFDCDTCACSNLCADKYSIWDRTGEGIPLTYYGTILERDGDRIRVQFNTNYIVLASNDLNNCCVADHWTLVSGGDAFSTAYNDCGVEFSGAMQHPVAWEGHCVHLLEMQALGEDRPIVDIFFSAEC